MRLRLLLVDSHTAFLTALSRFLQGQEEVEVVGQANTNPAAVELTRQLKPDLVLMDVDTAILPSIDAVRQIHREQPGVKIILWSIDPEPATHGFSVRDSACKCFTNNDLQAFFVSKTRITSGIQVSNKWRLVYLSSTNETTPDTAVSSGVTDTYIAGAPHWHSGPSDAIMPPESASVAL